MVLATLSLKNIVFGPPIKDPGFAWGRNRKEGTKNDKPIAFANIALGGIMFALPFLAPFMVAIGAMFGLGREIVESEGTSAEGVFTWYKKKFFSLAGGGLVLFIVVVGDGNGFRGG